MEDITSAKIGFQNYLFSREYIEYLCEISNYIGYHKIFLEDFTDNELGIKECLKIYEFIYKYINNLNIEKPFLELFYEENKKYLYEALNAYKENQNEIN